MSMAEAVETGRITTDIPARLDRLPWARWHWLVVAGLGTVWILDGLEGDDCRIDVGGAQAMIATGYYIGAGLMMLGGIAEIFLGVKAEGRAWEGWNSPSR